MARPQSSYVSPNRLGGSLCDESLGELLDSCKRNLITGTIRIEHDQLEGHVELRAGCIDEAVYGSLSGDNAIVAMRSLRDGMYELSQRLPRLTGALGEAAHCEGDLADVKLVELMRHCEAQALSCTVTVVSEFERGEIVYKCGDIVRVVLNGIDDEDGIVDIVGFSSGRFRVAAPPLSLDIGGWPSVTRDPTEPFRLDHLAAFSIKPRNADPQPVLPGTLPAPASLPGMAPPRVVVAASRPTSVSARHIVATPLDMHTAARAGTSGAAIGTRDFAVAGLVAFTVMFFAALLWAIAAQL